MYLFILLAACKPTVEKDDTAGPDSEQTLSLHGVLQFDVQHNMGDDQEGECVAAGDCAFESENEDDVDAWIEVLDGLGDVPVLHHDRAVPWLVFAEPPKGDPVEFYDARIDADYLAWLDAYAAWFDEAGTGYLAVAPFGGSRDRLQALREADGRVTEQTVTCPDLTLGSITKVTDADGVRHEIDAAGAWLNFARYLYLKLHPRWYAMGVEVDMFRTACEGDWDAFVGLYQQSVDLVREDADPDTRLFATFTLTGLLGYDFDRCNKVTWSLCEIELDAPKAIDVADCYPADNTPILDLAEGDRLDLLALSFYPDGLSMAVPGAEDAVLRIYEDPWDRVDACWQHAALPEVLDPYDAIDLLGWTGPVAMAETSARSCKTYATSEEGAAGYILELPGSLGNEAWWMERLLQEADAREMEFVTWSFARDYPPLGLWTWEDDLLDAETYSILNTWPCSGLVDETGIDKDGVTAPWRAVFH